MFEFYYLNIKYLEKKFHLKESKFNFYRRTDLTICYSVENEKRSDKYKALN